MNAGRIVVALALLLLSHRGIAAEQKAPPKPKVKELVGRILCEPFLIMRSTSGEHHLHVEWYGQWLWCPKTRDLYLLWAQNIGLLDKVAGRFTPKLKQNRIYRLTFKQPITPGAAIGPFTEKTIDFEQVQRWAAQEDKKD